jgi:hypothetical protein
MAGQPAPGGTGKPALFEVRVMMRAFLHLFTVLALIAPLAAACNPGDPRGPDRTEAQVDEAKLRAFVPFFPAAPQGYTRDAEPVTFASGEGSTVSFTYRGSGTAFTIAIGFSNKHAEEFQTMLDDEAVRTAWGYEPVAIAGRHALSGKSRGPARSDFVVVVSNSRSVTIAPASAALPDKEAMRRVFETVDFAGIGAKD